MSLMTLQHVSRSAPIVITLQVISWIFVCGGRARRKCGKIEKRLILQTSSLRLERFSRAYKLTDNFQSNIEFCFSRRSSSLVFVKFSLNGRNWKIPKQFYHKVSTLMHLFPSSPPSLPKQNSIFLIHKFFLNAPQYKEISLQVFSFLFRLSSQEKKMKENKIISKNKKKENHKS